MFDGLRKAWREFRAASAGYQAFGKLTLKQKHIVFYAESEADWAYLGPVLASLEERGHEVVRVCSDPSDPMLKHPRSYYVGSGSARTALFRTIQADAFVMTLTDLETFHLKRSVHPVHYFYIFHSIASTHRTYREHAFDAYDTILCVGPHHEREVRRTEEVYGLKPKRLAPHGYGRLDTLLADLAKAGETAATEGAQRDTGDAPPHVLLAPTWGDCSLVNHGIERLLEELLRAGFKVTLRFHPMTRRHFPQLADELYQQYSGLGKLQVDPRIDTTSSLLDADIMISEWSGAPLDYAFARLRPVIFMDTPPKIHNPAHGRLELPYLEEDIRTKIGELVSMDEIAEVPRKVRELLADAPRWAERIREIREQTVYHVGESGRAGADAILDTLAGGQRVK